MDLAKLRKDLERVHPGGTYTIDTAQLKELLTMAEAKVDPWRMFRRQPGTQEQIAHIHERLTALEEAVEPAAEAQQNSWQCPSCGRDADTEHDSACELDLLRALHRVAEPNTSALCRALGNLLAAGFAPPKEQS